MGRLTGYYLILAIEVNHRKATLNNKGSLPGRVQRRRFLKGVYSI
jgi:hypothetical protein